MFRSGLLAFGLVLTLGALVPNNVAKAADPVFCNNYASEAEKTVSFAKALKCGFQGPRWGSDKARISRGACWSTMAWLNRKRTRAPPI